MAVVGGGFAGLSAGVRLARHGARVILLEARSRLGGRATSFLDRQTGERVDNGQHILLGCYTETLAFLEDIGAGDQLRRQTQLAVTMIDRAGRRSRLECPRLPSPLHLIAGVLEWDALGWGDRWSILRMAAPLRTARQQLAAERRGAGSANRSTKIAASPGETVSAWLTRNGQTPRLQEMLWEPLALAALNQPPSQAAAPVFARVLAEMFGPDPQAAAILIPARPLEEWYGTPARQIIEARGGEVRTATSGRVRINQHGVDAVVAADRTFAAKAVIVAVPWFGLRDVFDGETAALRDILDRAAATAASPMVTVNLWFDRTVIEEPFLGLPGRSMQWVFDKKTVFGGQASHLSLVSSGASPLIERSNEALIQEAHDDLLAALPSLRAASLVGATVIREPRATFSLAPGQPVRPGTATPVSGLFLAGDWIDTGLPATIESAVRSGHRAAAAALACLA